MRTFIEFLNSLSKRYSIICVVFTIFYLKEYEKIIAFSQNVLEIYFKFVKSRKLILFFHVLSKHFCFKRNLFKIFENHLNNGLECPTNFWIE